MRGDEVRGERLKAKGERLKAKGERLKAKGERLKARICGEAAQPLHCTPYTIHHTLYTKTEL